MKNYCIADLSVNMKVHGTTLRQAEKYKVSDAPAVSSDIEIGALDNSIAYFKDKYPNMTDDTLEYLISGTKFYKKLVDYNGFMLHASAVVYRDKAYLFSAPCGVGKSTHASQWLKVFDGAYILNDDKPALRIMGDKVYVFGTPWSGKTEQNVNACVELGGIAFIHRDDHNNMVPMPTAKAIENLLRQTIHNTFSEQVLTKLLALWNVLLSRYTVYDFGCRPDTEAAKLAFETMKGN